MNKPHENPCEVRCMCGSLLAKLVAEGVELKCKRCRQIMVVPLEPTDLEVQAPAAKTH